MQKQFTTAALVAIGTVQAYNQSLADCQAFASQFSNTCSNNTPIATGGIGSAPAETLTCSGASSICIGDNTKTGQTTCEYDSVLCVTCSEEYGEVKIRVQSNSIPNHCWRTSFIENVTNYQTYDFTVTWNADMNGVMNYSESNFDSSDNTDTILCDILRTDSSNMHSSITYTEEQTTTDRAQIITSRQRQPDGQGPPPPRPVSTMTTASGVAVSGGTIFNGLAAGNEDAVINEVMTMDVCLSHTSPMGQLHYHSLSPCIFTGSKTQKPELCSLTGDCADDYLDYMLNGWTDTSNFGGVYGIARDGHVIYGPYNEDGELWGCDDHDACNGFWLDDGSYGYAATTTFPYAVGCWGPGPQQTYSASCTTNGCGGLGQASSDALASAKSLSALLLASLALFVAQ